MAAEKFNFSRRLFINDNGQSISFYMRPCAERRRLKPIVQHGGGTISYKDDSNCIKLLEPGGIVKCPSQYIKSKFVLDCASQDRFLDMEQYRCGSTRCDIDDDMSPAQHIVRVPVTNVKGRQKYTTEEDKKIIKYIVEERRIDEVTGKTLWKDMALFEVTNHPAESMRSRYLKYILPNIKTYNLPGGWIALLTGNTHDAHQPDQLSETSNKSPSKRMRLEATEERNDEDEEEEMEEDDDEGEEVEASQSILAFRPLNSPGQTSRRDNSVSPPKKTSSHGDELNMSGGTESSSDDDFDKMLLNTAKGKVRSKKGGGSPCGSDKENKENPNMEVQIIRKRGKSVKNMCVEVTSQALSESSATDSCDERLMNKANEVRVAGIPVSSPLINVRTPDINVRTTRSKRKGEVVNVEEVLSRASSQTSTPDSHDKLLLEKAESVGKTRKVTRNTSKASTPDDYDVALMEMGEQFMVDVAALTGSPKKSPQKSPKKRANGGSKCVKKGFSSSLLQFVMEESQENEPSLSQEVLEDEDSQVDYRQMLECGGKRFGLDLQEMVHVMYINTGSYQDAVHWIRFGFDTNGYPAWTESDDEHLLGTNESNIVAMEMKHGIDRLVTRRQFLDCL